MMSTADHVSTISQSCFHQLRQLRAVRKSLTPEALRTLVQSFISNRLDYCNSTLVGITDQLMQGLQAVQNAAARLIVGAKKFDSRQSYTVRPTLVASQTTHHFQALHSCLQVPPRHGPTLPVRVSSANIVASQWSSAALFFDEFTSRAMHSHMLQR